MRIQVGDICRATLHARNTGGFFWPWLHCEHGETGTTAVFYKWTRQPKDGVVNEIAPDPVQVQVSIWTHQ